MVIWIRLVNLCNSSSYKVLQTDVQKRQNYWCNQMLIAQNKTLLHLQSHHTNLKHLYELQHSNHKFLQNLHENDW